jgi:hypothetical protein
MFFGGIIGYKILFSDKKTFLEMILVNRKNQDELLMIKTKKNGLLARQKKTWCGYN